MKVMQPSWLLYKEEKEKEDCLFGFLTSSSTTRLYRGRAPRQSVWQFYVLPHMRQSWETMTSVSVCHIILTPTQPVGRGRPQRESNPGPPHQELRALPTELLCPPEKEEEKRKKEEVEKERKNRKKEAEEEKEEEKQKKEKNVCK